MVSTFTQMAVYIRVNGKTVYSMVKVSSQTQKEHLVLANGSTVKEFNGLTAKLVQI